MSSSVPLHFGSFCFGHLSHRPLYFSSASGLVIWVGLCCLSAFPTFGEEKIEPFLKMMVEKRLMFNEGERFLSLAVHAGLF